MKRIILNAPLKTPACRCSSPQNNDLVYETNDLPGWIIGSREHRGRTIHRVDSKLSRADRWGTLRARFGSFRMHYTVSPGIYALGEPDDRSDVFVSANYKMSFDRLRSGLAGLNAWILVLDTAGINVWCAAGKGTFGTDELVSRIGQSALAGLVSHRRIILPQLGAPGVQAHRVTRATGFTVKYGPVRSSDIVKYIENDYTATPGMRRVRFTMADRLVLIPMELIPFMKKLPAAILLAAVFFGLMPEGILFRESLRGGIPYLLFLGAGLLSGSVLTPLLLPLLPGRSFAVKGIAAGAVSAAAILPATGFHATEFSFAQTAGILTTIALSSYAALLFTGASTYTGMSGVEKELRIAQPLYRAAGIIVLLLLAAHKAHEWRLI